MAGPAAMCPCGGRAAPTFGLRLGAAEVASAPGEPIAPDADARRVPAGGRLTGELLLAAPDHVREGTVLLELVAEARGPQKKTNRFLHWKKLPISAGPVDTYNRWPFSFDVPPFPPSHAGFVDIEWCVQATFAPPKRPSTDRMWHIQVLPGAGTPPLARVANRYAFVRALWRDAFAVFAKLFVVSAWLIAPVIALLFAPQWLVLIVPFNLYVAWLGRGWVGPHMGMVWHWVRGWFLPSPGVPRALRLGDTLTLQLHPRHDWALVRVEESASRVYGMVGSTPGWKTEWSTFDTRICGGEGSARLTVPPDATPSLTTWGRRVRWEVRVWPHGQPEVWHPTYVEVLSERSLSGRSGA